MHPAVELRDVRKVFGDEGATVTALDEVSLSLASGTFTAIMGPSGSGKSTLLHVAAGLEEPTAGEVLIGGESLAAGSETARTKLRRSRAGVIFQQYNLLPSLTALQNVTLPLRLTKRAVDSAAAVRMLEQLGVGDRMHHRPSEMSGGQQQRVAIARALLLEPSVIFADEPTGALDSGQKAEVLRRLRQAVGDLGRTIVMVTHDPVDASHADEVVFLSDGRVAGSLQAPGIEAITGQITRLGSLTSVGR